MVSPYSDHFLKPVSNLEGTKSFIYPIFVSAEIVLGSPNVDFMVFHIFYVILVQSPILILLGWTSKNGKACIGLSHKLFSILSQRVYDKS